jgi:hypothetical protein
MENIRSNVSRDDSCNAGRRRRRTKDVVEGRDHLCSECGRRYLSSVALNNHITQKHKKTSGELSKRPRGRPKKVSSNIINRTQ